MFREGLVSKKNKNDEIEIFLGLSTVACSKDINKT
jgi:hypothetical protein